MMLMFTPLCAAGVAQIIADGSADSILGHQIQRVADGWICKVGKLRRARLRRSAASVEIKLVCGDICKSV